MARLRDNVLPTGVTNHLTLDRYQEIMLIDQNSFNGLLKSPAPDTACTSIPTQSERDKIGVWIQIAEQKRQNQLGHYLGKTYTEGEEQPFNEYNPYILNNKMLVEVGTQTTEDIADGVLVTLGTDPATVVVATAIATSEIKVYYPGEDVEIHPTSMVAAGGNVTITIPWARLIKPALNDDRSDHLQWSDTSNYLETVDIKRVYVDPATGIEYVWRPGINCTEGCTESTQTACFSLIGPRAYRISTVSVYPATWSGTTATRARFTYTPWPSVVRFNYVSGVQDMMNEMYTARLMHTITPHSPCSCQTVDNFWADDRIIVPGTVTPYGPYRASIDVFLSDSQNKVGQAFIIG